MSNVTGVDSMQWSHPNVPFAIIVSVGAGLATALGGSLVFMPQLLQRIPQATLLAISLALSAGVMLYVSFIEIFAKSYEAIVEVDGISEAGAAALTTTFFFFGMTVCVLLEMLVSFISRKDAGSHDAFCAAHAHLDSQSELPVVASAASTSSTQVSHAGDCGHADGTSVEQQSHAQVQTPASVAIEVISDSKPHDAADAGKARKPDQENADDLIGNHVEQKALGRMGMMTALAIAIHNFPEGLATFLATIEDTSLGASLGVAIAVHNIPEGLCVAMPIFYATGNKWKGFLWSLLSGLTEPIGGIIGFAILQPVFTPLVFGLIFSMVGGMMVFIVCHELMPAAHRYMGNRDKATMWLIVGMVIMAISLVLFML